MATRLCPSSIFANAAELTMHKALATSGMAVSGTWTPAHGPRPREDGDCVPTELFCPPVTHQCDQGMLDAGRCSFRFLSASEEKDVCVDIPESDAIASRPVVA
ncbi:hypothetical protein ElyMa_001073600 [Elysia marginata]|uniref:FZ domain-containing protein n=1 Tax=Elysia marginata TaxID=1093978 RepID=A0AAV4HRJ5_9GAST|nr:hypothetical protein ElyMa_001073600 [Elysia marginata]